VLLSAVKAQARQTVRAWGARGPPVTWVWDWRQEGWAVGSRRSARGPDGARRLRRHTRRVGPRNAAAIGRVETHSHD